MVEFALILENTPPHFRNVPHLLLSSYPSDIGHMDTAKMVAMDIMPPLLYLLRLLRLFFARNNQLCDETTEQFACSICLRENVQSVIFWILTLAAPTFVRSPFTSTGAHHFHRPCRRISRPLLSFVLVVWGTHTFPSALHSVKSGAIHPCDVCCSRANHRSGRNTNRYQHHAALSSSFVMSPIISVLQNGMSGPTEPSGNATFSSTLQALFLHDNHIYDNGSKFV